MSGISRIDISARRIPYVSLLLASVAVVIALIPSTVLWLQYDRVAIAAGEMWRLLTGHWTHVSVDHLLWDVLMFTVLGVLCEQDNRGRYAACLVSAAILIPLALWIMQPDIQLYRGLSGLDSALFTLLATTRIKAECQARHWGWVLALVAVYGVFSAKVAYELMTGNTLLVDNSAADMFPVPLAHGMGAAVGILCSIPHSPRALGRQ